MKFPRKSAWIADLRHPERGWRVKRNSPPGCGRCREYRLQRSSGLDKSKELRGGGGLINGLIRVERNEIIYKRAKIFFQFPEGKRKGLIEKVKSVSSVM